MNCEKEIQKLIQRFYVLENRISAIEVQIGLGSPAISKGKIVDTLVSNVSAVVGLKEAVSHRRRFMKYTWAILLILGLLATAYYVYNTTEEYLANPTSTNVEIARQPEYEYPSLVLCPGSWVDKNKALAKGLSLDALKYSLGFISTYLSDNITDLSKAKSSFREFYKRENYKSLFDYFQDITLDLLPVESPGVMAAMNTSAYMCTGCDNKIAVEKVLILDKMCFSFSFHPASAKSIQVSDSAPEIILQVTDQMPGKVWQSYLLTDNHILQPNFPSIALEPFTYNYLKVTPQRFVLLGLDDENCLDTDHVPRGYSAEQCNVECLHKLLKDHAKCDLFFYSANDNSNPPSNFCNYLDQTPGRNSTFLDFVYNDLDTVLKSNGSESCGRKCSYPCDRTLYTSTLHSKYQLASDGSGALRNAYLQNMSLMVVSVDHAAISQGGILTLTEVSNFSFATFVSNVGGTLGLFVGGTILTFFQLILWLLDYVLDLREVKQLPQ